MQVFCKLNKHKADFVLITTSFSVSLPSLSHYSSATILHTSSTQVQNVQNLSSNYFPGLSRDDSFQSEPYKMKSTFASAITDNLEVFPPQYSTSVPLKKNPDFVKPLIKNGWKNPNIRFIPSIYFLERSNRCLDCKLYESATIMKNLEECFRTLSLWVKYVDNPAGAALLSPEQVEMFVYLWNVEGGQKICIEVQRRRGDSLIFHKYARHILEAASGDFDSNEYMSNYSYFDARYLKEAEKVMKIGWESESEGCKDSFERIDYVLRLIDDKCLENKILGMESLCILSDAKKTNLSDAYNISRCILSREGEHKYGKIHDFIFYVIQKRCIPDDQTILSELIFDDDSDDEEYFDYEDRDADMPSEYKEVMRSLMMYGFTIVANCLEVISFAESCQVDPERTTGYTSTGSYYISKVLNAARNLTNVDLLETLLVVLGNENDQPHNACEAARCLKLLCRMSPEIRDVALKSDATQIAHTAKRFGSARHLKLEKECTELLQVLGK
jgi:hypothetical protein